MQPPLFGWRAQGTAKSEFLAAIMKGCLEKERAPGAGEEGGWIPCDPLAVALAVAPDAVIASAELRQCRVELGGGEDSRGRSVLGGRVESWALQGSERGQAGGGGPAAAERWGVVRLARGLNIKAFVRMVDSSLE